MGEDNRNSGARESNHRSNEQFDGWLSVNPKVLWYALVQDTVANVAIIDYDGSLLYCNEVMRKEFAFNAVGGEKFTLSNAFSKSVAKERLSLIRASIDAEQPLTLYGMLGGVYHCTIIRPIGSSKEFKLRAILWVCNAVINEKHDSPGGLGSGLKVVYAECHDLGILQGLTLTELEVLKLIGNSFTNLEISRKLHRSEKTIERYRNALGRKLGVRNRVDLAQIASTSGLLQLDTAKLV